MEYSDTHPQWSGLPQDLLSNIAKRFESRIHLLCFRAVCTTWRSSIPFPVSNSSSSLKLPFPIEANPFSNLQQQDHFTLTHSTIYCLQPLTKITNSWNTTKTWIVRVEEDSSLPGKVRLRDPLSPTLWDDFPKGCPKSLNMLDYRVTEITQAYELNVAGAVSTPSPDKIIGANLNGCFTVMTLMSICSKLAVWRVGDEKWTVIDDVCDNEDSDDDGVDVHSLPFHLQSQGYPKGCFIDIAYHNEKFYAVEFKGRGRTVAVDSSLKMIEVVPRSPDHFPNGDPQLVESSGDLFLILKYMRDLEVYDDLCDDEDSLQCTFNIYRMNEENQWVLQRKLGDNVFFLGQDCNFCVSARDFPGCRPSCMYIHGVSYDDFSDEDDDGFTNGFGCHPGYDVGIFDLENDDFEKPFQNDSKLFWPPPTWLKPNPPSPRC